MKKGFTLIELLITLSIMGIMAAILYPNFSKIQVKAKINSAQSVAHAVQMAVESYYMDQGTYPSGSSTPVSELASTLKSAGALNKIPNNPFTGKPYTSSDPSGQIYYTYDSDNNTYTLIGFGSGNKEQVFTLENN